VTGIDDIADATESQRKRANSALRRRAETGLDVMRPPVTVDGGIPARAMITAPATSARNAKSG
jgi:hypothetical protein